MKVISDDKYAFCTSIDQDNNTATLYCTNSKEEALKYIKESNYTSQSNAVLLLAFSFVTNLFATVKP